MFRPRNNWAAVHNVQDCRHREEQEARGEDRSGRGDYVMYLSGVRLNRGIVAVVCGFVLVLVFSLLLLLLLVATAVAAALPLPSRAVLLRWK